MKNLKISVILVSIFAIASLVNADEHREKGSQGGAHGKPAQYRQRGVPVGHNHIITHDGHEVTHPVITDTRPLATIHNGRNIVRVKRGFVPAGHVEHRWDHWHRDWGVFWRFSDWTRINQVTCEAVNTSNNYLYPVTGYRTDYSSGWSNDVANSLVEDALDNCYSESESIGANPDDCVLIDWECRYL